MRLKPVFAAGVFGVSLLLGSIAWFRRAGAGEVEAIRWERELRVEAFTPVVLEGWRQDWPLGSTLPKDGVGEVAGASNVRDCRLRERDTGAFQDWCTFDTYEWRTVGEPQRWAGQGRPDEWPVPDGLNPFDRVVRTEKIWVKIHHYDAWRSVTTEIEVPSGEVGRWQVGARASLTKDGDRWVVAERR